MRSYYDQVMMSGHDVILSYMSKYEGKATLVILGGVMGEEGEFLKSYGHERFLASILTENCEDGECHAYRGVVVGSVLCSILIFQHSYVSLTTSVRPLTSPVYLS